MSLFACLVCEKVFKKLTAKELLASDRDDTIIAIKCGHLFHRTCLDCAFVLQKVKLQVENRPERRFCPYESCQEDVTGFPLVQINPVEVKVDQGNEIRQLKNTIEKLTLARDELLKEIQSIEKRESEEKINEGDRVYWKEKEGKYTPATVQELQAKIKIENVGNSSGNQMVDALRSKFYNLPFMQEQTVGLTELLPEKIYLNYESFITNKPDPRPDSIMSRDSGFSASGESSPMEKLSHPQWSPPNSAGLGQQPRWMAGDRVFFPKEKQYATIKWVGYSDVQYKFIVAIEYDEPVGDTSLDTVNIPVRFKLGHGKKLDYEELNKFGVKEDINKNVFGFGRFKFGSGRRKGPPARSKSFQQNCNEIGTEENNEKGRRAQPLRSFSNPDANPNNKFQ